MPITQLTWCNCTASTAIVRPFDTTRLILYLHLPQYFSLSLYVSICLSIQWTTRLPRFSHVCLRIDEEKNKRGKFNIIFIAETFWFESRRTYVCFFQTVCQRHSAELCTFRCARVHLYFLNVSQRKLKFRFTNYLRNVR